MNALSKIETEAPYKDRFSFKVIPMNSPEGKASDGKYDWERQGHGLVILKPDGSVRAKFPGHLYADKAREKILAELDKALAE